jgi:sugar (pentulose or hexulose) kinase
MEWTKKLIGEEFSVIDKEAAARPIDKGLMVYPFISGGGSWHGKGELNYSVKGAKMMHDKFDLARATMEGVAFEIKYLIDLYRKSGVIDDKIIIAGGAARSEIWMQILSSVLDKEIYISNQADRCCFGAFSIAKKGFTGEDFVKFDFDGRVVEPDSSMAKLYKEKYEDYIKILN